MNKWRLLLSKIYRFFYPIDVVTMYQRMGVKIGQRCKFQFDVVIDYSHHWLIEIGNDVTIAPRVHILAHDASTKLHLGYTRIARVVIEDGVFIGAGSVVLPGVTIGRNSIIGSGSVVTHTIPPDMVYAGNPARPICTLEEFLAKKRTEMETTPRFEEAYTQRGGITAVRQQEMKNALGHSAGYVV